MPSHPPKTISIRLDVVSGDHPKDRNRLRKLLIDVFIKENPGMGRKPLSSEYKYFVETTDGGRRIFLRRPARLNKGFDFTVSVENYGFGGRIKDTPRHEDILSDLEDKCTRFPNFRDTLFVAIERIYHCDDPNEVIKENDKLKLLPPNGLPIDLTLKIIKWFFIEQDITYWNWSGRTMFFEAVKNKMGFG